MRSEAGHARVLGIVALACLAFALLLQPAQFVLWAYVLVLHRLAAVSLLAYPLAALALAEPARLSGDRTWWLVAVLAAIGASPALGVWLVERPFDPVGTALRAAWLGGVLALMVAAQRTAEARGRRMPRWAWGLLLAYAAFLLLASAVLGALRLDPADTLYAHSALGSLAPLLLAGYLLGAGRAGDTYRVPGLVLAAGGAVVGAGAMLTRLGDDATPFEASRGVAVVVAGVAALVTSAGIVLLAMGTGRAPADPPA